MPPRKQKPFTVETRKAWNTLGLDHGGVSEKAIHSAVIQHWKALGYSGTLVATIPNAGAMGQAGLTKGLPDLLVIGPGAFAGGIELKRQGGKPSPEQIAMQEQWRANGIRYEITFGRDEPIKLLEQWGITRPAERVQP